MSQPFRPQTVFVSVTQGVALGWYMSPFQGYGGGRFAAAPTSGEFRTKFRTEFRTEFRTKFRTKTPDTRFVPLPVATPPPPAPSHSHARRSSGFFDRRTRLWFFAIRSRR